MQRAFKTCLEIFNQRGYEVIDQETDRIIGLKQDGSQVAVFFVKGVSFNTESIQNYISIMNDIGVQHSMIVYESTLTPYANKIINSTSDISIELFTMKELQINITKHILVPKHERLSEGDSRDFKKKWGIKLPVLLKTDPIRRFYGYDRGDIIKVTRKNGYVSYRIVK